MDFNCELRLQYQLNALKQQTSIFQYIKQFRQLVLKLGDQAPDNGELLFIFVKGLKMDVKMQVILAQPQLLSEAEYIAECADMHYFRLADINNIKGILKGATVCYS